MMTLQREVPVLDSQVLSELEGLGADLGGDVLGAVVAAFQGAADLADPVERCAREFEVVHAELGKLVGKRS